MADAAQARVPAPAEAGLIEPAAVVIRRPTPGIVADPGPSIPVFPSPAARLVWSPIRAYSGGPPHRAVGFYILPRAVLIEILGAVDSGADILTAGRLQKATVPIVAPAIPLIGRNRIHDLELR